MRRIIDLEKGEEVQVETGYTNWNRADNEFYCTVSGISEDGMVILDAKNSVCFDGRNKIQPFFVVASLFQEIVENPPELPRENPSYDATELASAEIIVEDSDSDQDDEL